jgi:hypothetical protein
MSESIYQQYFRETLTCHENVSLENISHEAREIPDQSKISYPSVQRSIEFNTRVNELKNSEVQALVLPQKENRIPLNDSIPKITVLKLHTVESQEKKFIANPVKDSFKKVSHVASTREKVVPRNKTSYTPLDTLVRSHIVKPQAKISKVTPIQNSASNKKTYAQIVRSSISHPVLRKDSAVASFSMEPPKKSEIKPFRDSPSRALSSVASFSTEPPKKFEIKPFQYSPSRAISSVASFSMEPPKKNNSDRVN